VGALFLILASRQEDTLRLERPSAGMLVVTNVGRKEVDIQDVSINERKDCGPRVGLLAIGEFRPVTLRVGDQAIWVSTCRIVRVTVRTSDGADTYTFE
jgi:hypothetical protein